MELQSGEGYKKEGEEYGNCKLFLFPLCLLWHSVVWRVQVIRKKVQNSSVPLKTER